jgi:probable F420-dependent oxidoreductase
VDDRRFRFGMQAVTAASREDWVAKVRRIEDSGYAWIGVTDHLNDDPPGQLAVVPALAAAAAATTTLGLGSTVINNDFKHPAVLAKELASVDLLSDGRLIVGLGAGWLPADYEQTGMTFDRAGLRIERLAESVDVLKGLWGDGPFSYDGEHYRIDALDGQPKPVQRPHPPIMIGGGGRKILSLAARKADIVGINANLRSAKNENFFATVSTEGSVDEKVGWVREAAGDRFDDLELNVVVFTLRVTDDRDGVARELAATFDSTPEEVLATPHVLIGSVGEIVETLERRREQYGISNILIGVYPALDAFAPVVERLAGR